MAQVKLHAGALQQLKAAHNKFTMLPSWLSDFKTLNTVVLDNNELTELPKVIELIGIIHG